MANVALRGITKVYPGGVQALDRLDLTVHDREFLVLLGPSGCGKSTSLRLIAGLEEVTGGEVLIGDSVVNRISPKDRNIAMVFQNYALYPHMSVYKNMAFGLQLRYGGGWLARAWVRIRRPAESAELAVKRRGIPDRVKETARMLGIEQLLDRMPRQLSGGERQRVALGRAMVRQPAVFLFDEPLSNLDAKLRLETRRELKQLHGRLQATMIYVTHDQTEALTLGDRIAVLQGGSLQQIGTPAEIYDAPSNQFVAGFVGSPPMNFCNGRLYEREGRVQFESETMLVDVPLNDVQREPDALGERNLAERQSGRGHKVVMGVRPADVSISHPGTTGERATAGATGVIALIEPQGDDSYVHVAMRDRSETRSGEEEVIVCREAPRSRFRVSDPVELVIDERRLHLFDSADGNRLSEFGGG